MHHGLLSRDSPAGTYCLQQDTLLTPLYACPHFSSSLYLKKKNWEMKWKREGVRDKSGPLLSSPPYILFLVSFQIDRTGRGDGHPAGNPAPEANASVCLLMGQLYHLQVARGRYSRPQFAYVQVPTHICSDQTGGFLVCS